MWKGRIWRRSLWQIEGLKCETPFGYFKRALFLTLERRAARIGGFPRAVIEGTAPNVRCLSSAGYLSLSNHCRGASRN